MTDRVISDGSFIERTDPCPYCGGGIFEYRRKGPHIGAYCVFCHDEWTEDYKFVGWVKQWTDKDWDRYIKERALYRCERCGELLSGRQAHAHHKLPKWFMPELKYDINNGICLCTNCHKQIHGYGGTIKQQEDKNYETHH